MYRDAQGISVYLSPTVEYHQDPETSGQHRSRSANTHVQYDTYSGGGPDVGVSVGAVAPPPLPTQKRANTVDLSCSSVT